MPRRGKTDEQRRGERAAGQQIHELLLRRTVYRSLWEQANPDEIKPDEVNQAAVCRVLAKFLWDTGLEPDTRQELPRVLKDPVSRALRGASLTPKLLETFIQAFAFTDEDAEHVRRLHRGQERPAIIVGNLPPPRDLPGYRPPQFDKLKLQEHHWLGPDGLPARHRTEATIRSRVDGLTTYQYRIDTPQARIRAIRGGTIGPLYEVGAGLWAVDLTFPRPLRRNDEHYIEFWTLLKYDEPPEREMRCGTYERIEQLDLRVEFHPRRLPTTVWWAEWEHHTGPKNRIVDRASCELDAEHAVHRYLAAVERAVVGFCWEW